MISETPTLFSRTRHTSTKNGESVRKGQSWIASECRPSNWNEELCGRQLRTMSMRLLVLLGAASLCSYPTIALTGNQLTGNSQPQNLRSDNKNPAAKASPWPPQLEMRVPFEPTAFPSG